MVFSEVSTSISLIKRTQLTGGFYDLVLMSNNILLAGIKVR